MKILRGFSRRTFEFKKKEVVDRSGTWFYTGLGASVVPF